MSTQLKVFEGPHELQLCQYFGGVKGVCIQLSGHNPDQQVGCVGLTRREAAEVGQALYRWSRKPKDSWWSRFIFVRPKDDQGIRHYRE